MPRRRSTWGTNEDAGRGYRRLRYWADEHDGRGYVRHSKTIKGTRRDGDEELARLRVSHSSDGPVPTVRQAYETWWLPDARERVARGDMAAGSLTNYESRWRRHVEPAFGSVPVTEVRPLAMREWQSRMTEGSAKQATRILRQVLDYCVLFGSLPSNPARAAMPATSHAETERMCDKVYDGAQLVAAIEAMRGTVARIPAIMCGLGSCRVGEALGPRVEDVSEVVANGMRVAVVDIVRQVDKGGSASDALKTRASRRVVAIPEPWSLDVFDAAMTGAGGWLCPDGVGGPISQRIVTAAWDAAIGASGLERLPMRNLRNSWRTVMRWELGVPGDMLEKMMGHAGRNVGEVHYDRPDAEMFADVVSRAWNEFRAKS